MLKYNVGQCFKSSTHNMTLLIDKIVITQTNVVYHCMLYDGFDGVGTPKWSETKVDEFIIEYKMIKVNE